MLLYINTKIHIQPYVTEDQPFIAKEWKERSQPFLVNVNNELLCCQYMYPYISYLITDYSLQGRYLMFFLQANLCIFGSYVGSDSTLTTKTTAYGAKYDPKQDIALLCGKLVPTLERLELLSEV